MDFFKPGSTLKRADPKDNKYEHDRARSAYKRQLDTFKIKFDAEVAKHRRIDFDAKQEIRIWAKRLRAQCLEDYRQNLQGLARHSQRREYKDLFLGKAESMIEMHDVTVLDYELRLAEEIDSMIKNLALMNEDKSNASTIEWMNNLARQKFSYDHHLPDEELEEEPQEFNIEDSDTQQICVE